MKTKLTPWLAVQISGFVPFYRHCRKNGIIFVLPRMYFKPKQEHEMIKKTTGIAAVTLLLVGTASAQYTNTVYSEPNDGMVEYRIGWPAPTNHWENASRYTSTSGEWYGNEGLVCTVLPFQMPNLGIATNPFSTASFKVFLERNDAITPIDLYFVGSATNAEIVATSDYYSGTNDTAATMLQPAFIHSASGDDVYLYTDGSANSNLLDAMNLAYDGGAGAGDYVFLRLSYASDSFPTTNDSAAVHTRNYWGQDDWPTIILESNLDSDNDGMPNAWEGLYGLDPNSGVGDDGAAGDPDEDNRTNMQEYNDGTLPNEPDSDNDDLEDGDENTEGTDPLNNDSDGDGLLDGAEVHTHLTDPLDTDSDDDRYADGIEVSYGTDPTITASNPGANGIIALDGALDPVLYSIVSTQIINTAWGDNYNEVNAAYACVKDRRLYFMLTGNIEANWNKLEIFFDTTDAVQTNVLNTADGDNGWRLDGLTFDTAFEPDYHCYFRRDGGNAYFDIIDLSIQSNSTYGSLFNGEGIATTGTGFVNDYFMEVAYDNSNTGGVIGDSGGSTAAADHWTNSLFGLELSIDLRDLGNPQGNVQIAVMFNNDPRDYLSNQILGSLPDYSGSLGNGGSTNGTLSSIDFSTIPGDQFFRVDVGMVHSAAFSIGHVSALTGGTQMEVGLIDLTVGAAYKLKEAAALDASFTDVPGSGFMATGTTENITVPATGSVGFFKAVSP